ncbi:MAG TPA: DUF3105 domain-containing protein [Gaiellaceae bacterium]|nr:DUF3105 domain-containing protein [Gaiellaceae bacterium]
MVGGSALVVIAVVLGFLFLGGGSEGATVAAKFREGGCEFQTHPAAPTLRVNGDIVRHADELPAGYKYRTDPPASGVHANQTTIFGIYDEPVATISTVHNLEHGGVVIRYGPDVPEADVNQIREFYLEDPNGLVVAPLPSLKDEIALTAWTFDQGRRNEDGYEGEGRIAKCKRFDEERFEAFVEAFRGNGPEDFDVGLLQPGRG